jgi:hypothetical protein
VAVIYLAKTVNFPDPPPQKISNLTHLPIWEYAPISPDILRERSTVILDYVSALVTGIASIIAIFYAARRIDNKLGNVMNRYSLLTSGDMLYINRISWTNYLLSFILTAYITATFVGLAAAIVFRLGKLWAVFGIFHNIMEVCLLAALLQTGRKQFNFAIALLVVVIYGVFATAGTSLLEWYYDSMFFKSQGLVWDFMLPLVFFRVAVYAKNNPPANFSDSESTPLLPGSATSGRTFNPPRQLGYLVFASFVHLIGNIANTVGDNSPQSSLVFGLSYLVAFPIYTIYVRNESNVNMDDSQKVFDVPDTSVYEFTLIFLWGLTSSAITALVGINNMN